MVELSSIGPQGAVDLAYLENFVNDGSPSGFTPRNQLPSRSRPGSLERVLLTGYEVPSERGVLLGSFDAFPRAQYFLAHRIMFLHPDDHSTVVPISWKACRDTFSAFRTAGGRTFILADEPFTGIHVKVHYPGILGRVHRAQPYKKAVNGLEVSSEVASWLVRGGGSFDILREFALVGAPLAVGEEWDPETPVTIYRDATPYPSNSGGESLIPAFALSSVDSRRPHDPILLGQIIKLTGWSLDETLAQIILPLLEGYWSLVGSRGLVPELNGQNLLFRWSADRLTLRPVFRDLSRVEKAQHLRRRAGLPTRYLAGQYKVIDAHQDWEMSSRRHSFSFDFKLTRYVIAPLLEQVSHAYPDLPVEELWGRVREENLALMSKHDVSEFFPHPNVTWGFDRVLIDQVREYVNVGPSSLR